MQKIDLTFVPISGPGVDALNNRKETGSPSDIPEAELRASVKKSLPGIIRGFKMLLEAPIRR